MTYQLHKTTGGSADTVMTILEVLKTIGNSSICHYQGKHRISIDITPEEDE